MKKYLFVLMVICLGGTHLKGQNVAKNQALYIYNFTRYIEWPAYSSEEFVIGIVGNSNIYDELQGIASGKKVGLKSISVKKFNSINDISNCQILFVSNNVSASFANYAAALQGKNTLIITEKPGLANKGAGINFIIYDGKQKFELSKRTILKSGLKVSDQLVDMAILTD